MSSAEARRAKNDRRLRGYRIKSGLEELGDLDAPQKERQRHKKTKLEPTDQSAAPPSASTTKTVGSEDEATTRREVAAVVMPPVSHDSDAENEETEVEGVYRSVYGGDLNRWRQVKETLFSLTATPSEKRQALSDIRLWHARARKERPVPAYVEATELLMDPVLCDESDALSTHMLAQCYGAAVSRAVHVMTGSFAVGQANTYRKRAREIGFPEEAVEVRQRVAHGALPTLSELRWVCGLVLQFLFREYWVEQDKHFALIQQQQKQRASASDEALPLPTNGTSTSSSSSGAVTAHDTLRKAATRKPVPSTSIEEMKALLQALDEDGSDGEKEGEVEDNDDATLPDESNRNSGAQGGDAPMSVEKGKSRTGTGAGGSDGEEGLHVSNWTLL